MEGLLQLQHMQPASLPQGNPDLVCTTYSGHYNVAASCGALALCKVGVLRGLYTPGRQAGANTAAGMGYSSSAPSVTGCGR